MLEKKLSEYVDRFNEGFPMIPLGWGRSDDEIIELIDKCLQANKNAYEMGLVTEDIDIIY